MTRTLETGETVTIEYFEAGDCDVCGTYRNGEMEQRGGMTSTIRCSAGTTEEGVNLYNIEGDSGMWCWCACSLISHNNPRFNELSPLAMILG